MRKIYCIRCRYGGDGMDYCQHPSCESTSGYYPLWWRYAKGHKRTNCQQQEKNKGNDCRDYSPAWWNPFRWLL